MRHEYFIFSLKCVFTPIYSSENEYILKSGLVAVQRLKMLMSEVLLFAFLSEISRREFLFPFFDMSALFEEKVC